MSGAGRRIRGGSVPTRKGRAWRRVPAVWLAVWVGSYAQASPAADPSLMPADEHTAPGYFYRGIDFGSEAAFHPLSVLVNNGFDILRQPSYSDYVFQRPWGRGFENVWENLRRPGRAIRASGGFARFFENEVFPFRGLGRSGGQFSANYALHLLGEGMVNRKLSEWYAAHDFPVPMLWAVLTSLSALALNEAGENGDYRGPNWDPIADVLIFNPLGYLLFSIDAVAAWFSGPVQLNYWPGQPVFEVRRGELYNHAENYAMKVSLGRATRARAFFHFGTHGMAGLSLPTKNGDSVSFGLGVGLVGLDVEPSALGRTVTHNDDKNFIVGVFWDREESLLGSLELGAPDSPNFRLNLYPGWLGRGRARVGAYAFGGRYEGFGMGVTLSWLPVVPGLRRAGDRTYAKF